MTVPNRVEANHAGSRRSGRLRRPYRILVTKLGDAQLIASRTASALIGRRGPMFQQLHWNAYPLTPELAPPLGERGDLWNEAALSLGVKRQNLKFAPARNVRPMTPA